MVKCAPLVPNRSCKALLWSAELSVWMKLHPASLKAPPKPSQLCIAVPSLTVTSAVPVVTTLTCPVVFQ